MKLKEALPIYLSFISPKKRLFIIFVSSAIFTSFIEIISIYIIIPIVNIILGQNSSNEILRMFVFTDSELMSYSILLIAISIILTQVRILNNYIKLSIVQKIRIYWQNMLVNIILRLKYIRIKKYTEGELFFINNEAISSAVSSIEVLSTLGLNILNIIVFIAFLLFLSFEYTLVIIPILSALFLLVRLINIFIVHRSSEKMHKALNIKNILIHEIISGLKTIRVYCAENSFSRQYNQTISNIGRNRIKIHFTRNVIVQIINIIPIFGLGLSGLYLSINTNPNSGTDYGLIGVYILVLIKLFPKISSLADLYLSLIALFPNSRKYYEFINQENKEYKDEKGNVKLKEIGDIEINSISFLYSNKTILKNISFSIKKGETVALVGESGSGKSTILNILLKLLTPQQGNITIGKQNLAIIDKSTLYNKIGYVSQEIFLFNDTLGNNIKLYREDISENNIDSVLKRMNILGFVDSTKKGIDYFIENNGANL